MALGKVSPRFQSTFFRLRLTVSWLHRCTGKVKTVKWKRSTLFRVKNRTCIGRTNSEKLTLKVSFPDSGSVPVYLSNGKRLWRIRWKRMWSITCGTERLSRMITRLTTISFALSFSKVKKLIKSIYNITNLCLIILYSFYIKASFWFRFIQWFVQRM